MYILNSLGVVSNYPQRPGGLVSWRQRSRWRGFCKVPVSGWELSGHDNLS